MSRQTERQRAVALKAADARELIKPTLPFVLEQMSAAQLDQVQRVLDAAVVNPAVQKEVDELYRKSVIAESGGLVNRDPAMVRRADKAAESLIPITEADKRVRLDFEKLLTPDALKAKTDNPDEKAFLSKIRQTLKNEGVWLRFDLKLVRDPDDPSRTIRDPRTFQAWLSLGAGGDAIPTDTGRLTRAVLLGNGRLGAGYYREVIQGKIQSELNHAIRQVQKLIDEGEILHQLTEQNRRGAAPGVVGISDWLGDADYPPETIWDDPHRVLVQALKLNSSGDVKLASKRIIIAAYLAASAAQRLANYIQNSVKGAERAVTALAIISMVGEIVGYVLLIYSVAAGLIRLLAIEGAAAEAGAGAGASARTATGGAPPVTRGQGALHDTNYLGREALEDTLNQVGRTAPSSGGAAEAGLDRYTLAEQERMTGWMNEAKAVMEERFKATGRGLDMKELDALIERLDAKWGNIVPD